MSKLYDRIGPFTTIPNSVFALWPQIGTDAMGLFLFLRYRTNQNTGDAFPSYDGIQRDTGMSRRRIARAIRALVDAGLMERKRRFSDSTIYTICAPEFSPVVAECDQCESAISSTVALPLVHHRAANKIKETRSNEEIAPARPGKKSATPATDKPQRPAWVDLYQEVFCRNVAKEMWHDVTRELGENPDLDRLREIFTRWKLNGWNRKSFGRMLEVYRDGWRTNGNGQHAPTAEPRTTQVAPPAPQIVRIYKD